MALVLLPGLSNLIEDISEEKKLPPQVVEAALREALLKGYERYRRTLYLGISEDPFDEEYFSNFDVGLDLDEEGYRVLASKIIVDEVESEDHQIALSEVMQVADDAQLVTLSSWMSLPKKKISDAWQPPLPSKYWLKSFEINRGG
jgi:N utilization substance protein A